MATMKKVVVTTVEQTDKLYSIELFDTKGNRMVKLKGYNGLKQFVSQYHELTDKQKSELVFEEYTIDVS